jgi:hypothetical protein
MNVTTSEYDRPDEPDINDSLNCVDVVIEGHGDTTVRPLTGKRRELLLAERDRLCLWLEQLMRQYAQGDSDDFFEITLDSDDF